MSAPVTPEQGLAEAEQHEQQKAWPEARTGAVQFLVARCSPAPSDLAACTRAELTRGNAELALGAPEAAYLSFSWAAAQGAPGSRESAQGLASLAANDIQKLLGESAGQTLLVIEHDFEDDARFAPETTQYTLDGQPLGSVLSRTTLRARRHRVLAKPIAPGTHQLGVEVHWKGEGTFSDYAWSAYYPFQLEAPADRLIKLFVSGQYEPGSPSNKSARVEFSVKAVP